MRIALFGHGSLGDWVRVWLRHSGVSVIADTVEPCRVPESIARLRDLQLDYGLSVQYRHKLPPEAIQACGQGVANLHTGYLPWNRGAYPNVWPLLDGSPAGVTLHWMDEGWDTGPIIDQRSTIVEPWDTAGSLYQKLEHAAQRLLMETTWDAPLPAGKRQPSGGTFHTKREFHDLAERPNIRILDLLRACTFPGKPGLRLRAGLHVMDATITLRKVEL